ncbi:hypothetical protein [Cerasicoccus arenae]|uniref:CBM-cenC domain-containing protein n=1 Tax=Cerasicoccus arenae TaxID=424488 RepID=A0A8J3DJ62_9BACT|nr:hypothetical protein [Cerasicoccus arenae]MBK1857597.1 hypothetical protein [Cerasicoccus arenae]GHC05673.1 hypothetical protein GCM10007047_23280 [Cerasicoccus arenae]
MLEIIIPRVTLQKRRRIASILACFLLGASATFASNNLITNGDFAVFTANKPASWRVPAPGASTLTYETSSKPTGANGSLRVTIDTDGQGLGQILQKFPVKPGGNYLLEGWVKSDGSEGGQLQIKLYSNKKEIKRISVPNNGIGWEKLSKQFVAEGAEEAAILLRYKQTGTEIGNTLWFADISVTPAPAIDSLAQSK